MFSELYEIALSLVAQGFKSLVPNITLSYVSIKFQFTNSGSEGKDSVGVSFEARFTLFVFFWNTHTPELIIVISQTGDVTSNANNEAKKSNVRFKNLYIRLS